jgi:hypothetical protein
MKDLERELRTLRKDYDKLLTDYWQQVDKVKLLIRENDKLSAMVDPTHSKCYESCKGEY